MSGADQKIREDPKLLEVMLSDQEVFDQVAKHLLTQKKQSRKKGTTATKHCMYYGPGNLKDPVGCFIPEELYTSEIEGKSVCLDELQKSTKLGTILVACQLVTEDPKNLDNKDRLRFLGKLQEFHDSFKPTQWKKGLEILAKKKKLNDTVLRNF